ncbi:hypothetical protein FOZ63_028179, partial [Perkinsus olseni]
MAALARAAAASSSLSESGVSLNEPSTTMKGKWAAAVEPGGEEPMESWDSGKVQSQEFVYWHGELPKYQPLDLRQVPFRSAHHTPATDDQCPQYKLHDRPLGHLTSQSLIPLSDPSGLVFFCHIWLQKGACGSSMSAGGLSLAVEGVEAPSTFLRTAATPPGLSQGATPSIWPVAESATRRPEAAAALGTYFESRLFLRRLIVIYMNAWLNITRRRRQQRRLCRYVLSRAATRVKSSALTFWRTLLCRRTAAHSVAESRSVVSKLVALARSFHAWRRLTDTGRTLAEAKLRSHQYRGRIMLKAALWAWRVLAVRLSKPYRRARSSQTMTPPKQHNCTAHYADAACGADEPITRGGRKLTAFMALLVWRNRVLEQRLSEARHQALGETDGIASS